MSIKNSVLYERTFLFLVTDLEETLWGDIICVFYNFHRNERILVPYNFQ